MINYENYTIQVINENLIRITNTTTGVTKDIKIKYDYEFIFKAQKTQIKSRYNASRLLQEFQKWIDENFMNTYVSAICRNYVG